MQLECRIGIMSADVAPLSSVPNLTTFIEQHFQAGSHGDIDLRCLPVQIINEPLSSSASVTALQLHYALYYLNNNPAEGPISHIGVLLADSYGAIPGAFGIMFDRGVETEDDPNVASVFTQRPRQGCAVFLGAILRSRGAGEQYMDEVLFTCVHELGHVFNLQHDETYLNFMHISGSSAYGDNAYLFTPHDQGKLSVCSVDKTVTPGGGPFGDEGAYGNLDNPPVPRTSFGLELLIDARPREFWHFEPVQLEIELRHIGGGGHTIDVPDEIDPGSRMFRLMIEDPRRERRLYRAPFQTCGPPQKTQVGPKSPYQRDLPLFVQAGGYSFLRAGEHKVWVEFETGRGTIRSNVIAVNVKAEIGVDRERDRARAILTDRGVRSFLFHREDAPDLAIIRRLSDSAGEEALVSCRAELHYSLGRALFKHMKFATNSAGIFRDSAVDHLKRALDHENCGPHKSRRIGEILAET